ncbi:hypothetical protein HNV12_15635 [Methanococcoides sp. SA1]|nr:hypothetical protein [Methanococcoides sp. SA1]
MRFFRKILFVLLVFLCISIFICPSIAQDNNVSTVAYNNETTPNHGEQNSNVPINNNDANFDRTLSILNTTLTAISALIGLIALVISSVIVLGLFEYKKWVIIRNDAEKDVGYIKELRNKAEDHVDKLRNKVEHESLISSKQTPSKDVINDF